MTNAKLAISIGRIETTENKVPQELINAKLALQNEKLAMEK